MYSTDTTWWRGRGAFLRPFTTPLLPLGVLLFLAVTALASSHAVFPLFPALLVALFLSVRRFGRVGARRAVPGVAGPTDGPSVLPSGEVGRERELLLALERHGEITAARAALETSMGVAETEAMLDMLATNGHVRVIAREGTLAYALWE